MFHNEPKVEKKQILLENIQDFYSEILEYYDELFPLNENALNFIEVINKEICKNFSTQPAPLSRYLGIGCATGTFENKLDSIHLDITGIDKNPLMIETAMRRMKRSGTTSRFFEMSTIDIGRFLQKNSFHIIACIDNTLPYISDLTLMKKFFHDTKKLLAPGGRLIIQTHNFDSFDYSRPISLPEKSSIRVRLMRSYSPGENNQTFMKAELELGNGNTIGLSHPILIQPTPIAYLIELGKDAGFSTPQLYGDFKRSQWTIKSPMTIAVFRAS